MITVCYPDLFVTAQHCSDCGAQSRAGDYEKPWASWNIFCPNTTLMKRRLHYDIQWSVKRSSFEADYNACLEIMPLQYFHNCERSPIRWINNASYVIYMWIILHYVALQDSNARGSFEFQFQVKILNEWFSRIEVSIVYKPFFDHFPANSSM